IVSDNASTDATAAISRDYAARDGRIAYHRNQANLGAVANLSQVVRLGRGEFFMWAAHDDAWHPEYIAANLANLLADPRLVASVSRVQFVDQGHVVQRPFWEPLGTAPLQSSMQANLRRYLLNPGLNSRFYALFRREALLRCLPLPTYCGGDWTLVVRTL